MKKKNNRLPLMLCISLVLHGCLFFLSPGYSASNSRLPKAEHTADPFALVNLAPIEPAAPEPFLPPAAPPPPLPESTPPPDLSEAPAETFIPVEEFPPETAAPGPGSPAGSSPAGAAANGARTEAESALTAAYTKRNYDYIQRRIREKLLYPTQARRAGLQGTAELSFTIYEDGSVSDVTVTRSSGSEFLDSAAAAAIQAAAPFRPPPSPARIIIPVAFRLR
jgi:protein TonB